VEAAARREYIRAIGPRYQLAGRAEKGRILDEFCQVTGYHRKSALRRLHAPPRSTTGAGRRGRPVVYGPAVASAIREMWAAAGYPWSVRLQALIPLWLAWARRRFHLSALVCAQLQTISPRQIDRVLQPMKRTLKTRRYGRTKPGRLLKHHIPIKTDRWDVQVPGFTEVDLVAHNGSRSDGEFAHSLNVTDVHTTWNETRAVLGRGEVAVQEALDEIRQGVPFRLRGIDSDNGSEFINDHLFRYCQAQEIQFTRGRPYKKDDNAHIEQKNWTHVRKVVGYLRYDTAAAVGALNDLYRQELRLFQNLFLPSVKLVRKERVGARVRRRYDTPRTPLDRVQTCPEADPTAVARFRAQRERLDPFALAAAIDRKLARLEDLGTPGHAPVRPAVSAGRRPPAPRPTPRRDFTFGNRLRRPRPRRIRVTD
jgi:hypothetical protein